MLLNKSGSSGGICTFEESWREEGSMKKRAILFLAVGVGAALLAGCATLGSKSTEADAAAIREIWAKYVDSAQKGDAAAYLSLWDKDGIQLRSDAPARTKAELDAQMPAQLKARVAASDMVMVIDVQEITITRPWAYSRGLYTQDFVSKSTGARSRVDGKFLTIFTLQDDGSWRIFRDCFNSNVPPK
jgi:uncharacterized protein (TIGR02246 family)